MKIKNYFIIGLTFIFINITTKIYCQNSGENEPGNVNYLTYNTFNMNSFTEIPFTGDLTFSQPILTIPGRNGLDYTLYLDYNGAIRTRQRSSWVGLGFNLQIGGISRQVVKRPDDQDSYIFNSSSGENFNLGSSDEYEANVFDEHSGLLYHDNEYEEWDLYTLQLSNITDRLIPLYNEYGYVDFVSEKRTSKLISYSPPEFIGGFLENFSIIAENGTNYQFNHRSDLKVYYDQQVCDINVKFPISWDLTEIFSSDYIDENSNGADATDKGSWIKIEYDDYAVNNNALNLSLQQLLPMGESKFYGNFNQSSNACGASNRYCSLLYDYSNVKYIKTPTHTAEFVTSARDDLQGAKKLDKIILRDNNNNTIKILEFKYAQNVNSSGNNWVQNEKLKNNCLTLVGVKIYGNSLSNELPGYKFEYDSNPNLIDYSRTYSLFSGIPAPWTLKTIQFPEGGKISYQFEPDTYSWFYNFFNSSLTKDTIYYSSAINTAGYRINQILIDNGMDNIQTYSYQYGEGVLNNPLTTSNRDFSFDAGFTKSYNGEVGYRWIKTNLPESSGSVTNYFTTSVNTSGKYLLYNSSGPTDVPVISEAFPDHKIYNLNNNTWVWRDNSAKRGNTWKKIIKNQQDQPVETINDNYTYEDNYGHSSQQTLNGNNFPAKTTWIKLISTNKNKDGVSSTKNYSYKPYDQSNFLAYKTEEYADNNNGTKKIDVVKYAFENYDDMKNINMMSQIYSSTSYLNTESNSNAYSSTKQIWVDANNGNDGFYRFFPCSTLVWREDISSKNYSGENDPDYLLTSQRVFNDYGNLIEETDGRGNKTKFVYGHKNSKLIGKVVNTGTSAIIVDNFNDNSIDDSDPYTWTKSSGWSVTSGKLQSPNSSSTVYANVQGQQYQSFNADVQLNINSASSDTYWAGIHFATTTANYGYGYTAQYRKNGDVILYSTGNYLALASTGLTPFQKNRKLSVSVNQNNIKIFVDGKKIIDYNSELPIPTGYVALYAYSSITQFDNFRVYPNTALAKGYAYDPITLNITEETDENNNSTYHEYDNFGRMINKDVLLNGDKNRIDHTNYYLSRSGNGDVFNSNDPNRLESENYFNVTDKISKCDFYDGFNKKMQDQYLEIDNIIVGNTLEYNALGSISKLYKPYPKNGTTFSYDNNYLVNSDNYYTSGLGNYGTYSATGNRPYYEIKYSSDPIQRKIQEIPEGLQWFSNNKLINYTYGGNVANDQIPLGTGTYSANSLFKNELTNENGIVTQFYNDIFGNLIAQKTNPTGLNLKTFYTFDILGNQTKKTDPKGFISTMDFNTLKLLKTKSTPDRGSVRYLYDQNSNMRFYQTSEHNTTSINSFYTNQNKIGVGSWSGTFTLVKPSLMQLYAQSFNTNSSINEKIILKIKNTTTSVVTIVELIAEDNGSLIVTKSFRLPKGSFKWEVTTTGASNSQFNFYVDSRNNMQFEYHNYDNFNRLIQSGENYYNYASSSYFQQSNADNISFPSSGKFINKDFIYDIQSTDILAVGQRNLKGRLSYTKSYIMNDLEYTSFYSYDDIGNIEWILNKWVTGKNNKIKYSYDLQRNITKQEFTGDQSFYNYYKFFEYDKLGRLVNVYTDKNSASGATKLKEITYIYNPDNSLKRMELGAEGSKAQGLDYLYNTRGWLSQINHQNINSSQDPGSDNGLNGKPQVDKFGMVIGYNNISDIGSTQSATAQWNGNISWMMYNMSGATFPSGLVGNTYSYDNANRLLSSNFGYYISSWQATSNYDVNNITYDNNGNLNTIRRYWNNGQIFDNQTFYYLSGKNQLNYVYDSGTSSISVNDVDNQSSGNYLYDGNGSMVQDAQQGIGYILYNSDNLPIKQYYINGDVVEYIYDAYGNRVTKKVVNDLIHWNYANGINGNTEARIKENSNPPVLIKHNIWGNDLAGTFEKEVYTNYVETKTYYLKDHLGNIKVRVNESGSVVGYDDYYPFGMIMNGRSNNTGTEVNYKYTSKERDLETGLDYFGARYYDSKIARWLSVDPLADKYPDWSPYNYILSNPLNGIDPNGEFTLKFIKNTYYLHRESINTAKFATFIEGFLPTLVQLGIIVKEQYFPRDPSYEVQTIGERLFSLGASYVGDNTIYSHELGNRVSKTMTFLSGFSKWKEIKPNFIYDEYLFRQLSEYNREGISAFLKGEIIGINNRTGEPLFEPSEDGLSLMLNPHYVNMFYNGNVHDAMKSIILQRQKQEDEERRAAKALNKFIDEYGKK